MNINENKVLTNKSEFTVCPGTTWNTSAASKIDKSLALHVEISVAHCQSLKVHAVMNRNKMSCCMTKPTE